MAFPQQKRKGTGGSNNINDYFLPLTCVEQARMRGAQVWY